jgi:hypothetical protein
VHAGVFQYVTPTWNFDISNNTWLQNYRYYVCNLIFTYTLLLEVTNVYETHACSFHSCLNFHRTHFLHDAVDTHDNTFLMLKDLKNDLHKVTVLACLLSLL